MRCSSIREQVNTDQNKKQTPRGSAPSSLPCLQPETPLVIRVNDHFAHINNYVCNVSLNLSLPIRYITLSASNAEYIPIRIKAVKLHLTNDVVSNNITCLVFESGYMIISGAPTENDAIRETHRYLSFLRTVPMPVWVKASPCDVERLVRDDPCAGYVENWHCGWLPPSSSIPSIPFSSRRKNGGHFDEIPPGQDCYLSMRPLGDKLQCTSIQVVNIVSDGIVSEEPLDLKRMSADHAEIADYDPEIFPGLRLTIEKERVPGLQRQCKAGIFDSGKAIIMGTRNESDTLRAHHYLRKFVAQYIDHDRPSDLRDIYNYRIQKTLEPTCDDLRDDFTIRDRFTHAAAPVAATPMSLTGQQQQQQQPSLRIALKPSPGVHLNASRKRHVRTIAAAPSSSGFMQPSSRQTRKKRSYDEMTLPTTPATPYETPNSPTPPVSTIPEHNPLLQMTEAEWNILSAYL